MAVDAAAAPVISVLLGPAPFKDSCALSQRRGA